MNLKKVFTSGLYMSLAVASATIYAEDDVQTQSRNMNMLQQGNAYAEKEGRNYTSGEMSRAKEQNKNQYRYGADNETGQGTKTRTRSRDGSGSGSQSGSGGSRRGGGGGGRH